MGSPIDKRFMSVAARIPVKTEVKPYQSLGDEFVVKHPTQGSIWGTVFLYKGREVWDAVDNKGSKLTKNEAWIMSKT